ncbi:MAG TPA: MFS transporter [Firmicutes bacterium]|nr:MFS transporter [Bacillota bacterium]
MIEMQRQQQVSAERSMFRALYNRNYRLLWIGLIISSTGAWMQTVAQGWLVFNLTGRATDIGMIALMRAIPLVSFSLFGGAMADFMERRKLLYITQSIQGSLAMVLGILVYTGRVQVYHVYIVAMCTAAALAFDQPARQSLIPRLVKKDELMNALVLNSIAYQGSGMLGPTLTGLLVPYIGIGGCYVANALSYGAVLIALYLIDMPPGVAAKRTSSLWRDLTRSFYEMREDTRILALVLTSLFVSFFGRGYNQYMPVYADLVLHVGVRELGFLMSGSGVGTVLASLIVAKMGNISRKGRLIVCANVFFSLSLIGFAWSSSFLFSFLLLTLVGGLFTLSQAMTNTSVQLIARDEVRGRITSLFTLTGLAAMPLGQVPLGALIEQIGPSPALSLFALTVGLGTIVVALIIRPFWRMD